MKKLTYKFTFVSALCASVLALTACQTPEIGKKDPEKAVKIRTQLAVEHLKAGDLDITVFQNGPGQGKLAIDVLLKLMKHETVEKKNFVPFELVTKENLDKYVGAKQ